MNGSAERFPDGFLWGAATASYQIEGAVHADGRGESIWDRFSHTPGKVFNGDTGDVACDHFHRFADDVALMADLGLQAYRFSIAWPRVQPGGSGALNQAGLDFYRRLLEALHAAGIRPFPTLYHWDLPQELEDAGGWPARDTARRFADYAVAVHEALGDLAEDWSTLNEPWCSAFLGYASGVHAPGRIDHAASVRAAHHLLLGHGLAVRAMREQRPDQRFGITLNLYPVDALSADPLDIAGARRVDGIANRIFLDPVLGRGYPADVLETIAPISGTDFILDGDEATIAAPIDALGVNYYSRHYVRADGSSSPVPPTTGPDAAQYDPSWVGAGDVAKLSTGLPRTAMGWEVDADGLYETLVRLQRDYDAPTLYVTENGAAYDDVVGHDGRIADHDRLAYLRDHFAAARRAIADGVDLGGYFVWSLLDNFEWGYGYGKRFGIVHVDYDTLVRTPKASAHWYRRVIAANAVVD